jgi:hypothetical protein
LHDDEQKKPLRVPQRFFFCRMSFLQTEIVRMLWVGRGNPIGMDLKLSEVGQSGFFDRPRPSGATFAAAILSRTGWPASFLLRRSCGP